MTRARQVVGAVVVLLVLAGCASLPSRGPVQRGVEGAPSQSEIVLLAEDPKPGASPTDIVRGFLSGSAAGLPDEFAVARKYLTADAGRSWRPNGGVTVFSNSTPLVVAEVAQGLVQVTVAVAGTVDARGVYSEAPPGTTTTIDYRLVQDADGEWRVSELADGVLMSEVIFGTQYRQTALYFLTPDGEALVPDIRWFPHRNAATYALRALFAGTVEWLAPGVISAVPPGTSLSPDAVPISGGVAQVDLTEEVRQALPADRQLLRAQIARTLGQLPQVQQVVINVEGILFSSPGPEPELIVDPVVGRSPAVLSEGHLMTFTSSSLVQPPDAVPLTPLAPSHPALPYDDRPAVMLAGADRLVTVPTVEEESQVLVEGVGLVPPSYDRHGWAWTGDAVNAGFLVAAQLGQEPVQVEAPGLAGTQVRSVRVSRDGARVAVIAVVEGVPQVQVSAVVRDGDGRPLSVGAPLSIAEALTAAQTLTWVDEQTVAVLGVSTTANTVHLATVGGPTIALPTVTDAVSVAAGRGDRELFVATSDGVLYARSGNGWRRVADGVADPAFPG